VVGGWVWDLANARGGSVGGVFSRTLAVEAEAEGRWELKSGVDLESHFWSWSRVLRFGSTYLPLSSFFVAAFWRCVVPW
jgi:hypothetical protein